MKHNFTLVKTLFLFICLGFFTGLSSQVQFNYTPSQFLVAPGQTDFEVNVSVTGFNDIVASQFAITWDSTVLRIDTLSLITDQVQGLNSSSFSLPMQTNDMKLGRVFCSWTDPSTNGVSLPLNTFLFRMKFTVIGDSCDVTDIGLGVVPGFASEAIDNNLLNVGISDLVLPIEVAGSGCNTFLESVDCNDFVSFSLDPNVVNNLIEPDFLLEGGPYDISSIVVTPESVSCEDIGETTFVVTNTSNGNSCWGVLSVSGEHCDGFNDVLVCNEKIFASVDQYGLIYITPDMALEGGPYNYNTLTVSPQVLSCDDIGEMTTVTVTDTDTGNSCFSTFSPVDPAGFCDVISNTLTCKAVVEVAIGSFGSDITLEPEILLEGGPYNYDVMSVSPEMVSCDDVNTLTTMTVTNTENGSTCFGLLKVRDVVGPVPIAEQNITIMLTESPNGGVPSAKLFAESVDEGSYDNCGDVTFSPLFWEFDCSDIGTQTISMEVIDESGNINTVWTEVTIEAASLEIENNCDIQNSENLFCNTLVNVSLGPFESEVILDPDFILEGGPYDYDVLSVSPEKLTCDDINKPITVTVTNTENGNSCFGIVKLEDKMPPAAIAKQNIVIQLTQPSNGGEPSAKLFAESVDNGSFDNCGDITFSPLFWEFDCSDIGVQTIVMDVIDGSGNLNTVFTEVTIETVTGNTTVTCPSDLVVDCNIDIYNLENIDNILGAATIGGGCNLPFNDILGYDVNGDNDLDDTHFINGEEITEQFNSCQFGTIKRVWTDWNTNDVACEQIIGIRSSSETFDGLTMIDWPYSLNAVVDLGDNDTGASCGIGCENIDPQDISLDYDANGLLIGSSFTTDCANSLCEDPIFEQLDCSLIGFSAETTIVTLPNGDDQVTKVITVIDWCGFDPLVPDSGGIWTYTVNALVIGGFNKVSLSASDVTANTGQQVCMPIRVSNFKDVESFQGSIAWDQDVVSFNKVTGFGLEGLSNSSFGLNETDNGILTFLWFDHTTVNPATLTDNASIFSICFDVIGDVEQSTLVEFVNEPTEIEFVSELLSQSFTTKNGSVTVKENNCTQDNENPVPFCINSSTVLLANGEAVVFAEDFNVGSFDNCTPDQDLRFTFSDINPVIDPNFTGQSSFKQFVTSDLGGENMKTISESIYVWDSNNNVDFCQINVTLIDNGDTVESEDVTLEFGNVIGGLGTQICMPLTVEGFSNVSSIQGSINWDPSVIEFTNLNGFNIPSLSASNFNLDNTDSGVLSFVWFDQSTVNSATLTDNASIFSVCFEAIGNLGEVSNVTVSNNPVFIEVTKVVNSRLETVDHELVSGTFTILDANCSIEENQITWPLPTINVFESGANLSNASDLLSPDNLLTYPGLESEDVFPSYTLGAGCQNFIAHAYSDEVFDLGQGQIEILRMWTVVDWISGNVFTFEQTIKNFLDIESPICDTLPNSAPLGDCDSGHTLDDDVEWPDNVSISDHRITPEELVSTSGVDPADAKPIFFNVPDQYIATYSDSVGGLSPTFLNIKRIWTVTRLDLPGFSWRYVQCVDVDLSDFGKLVTVSTLNNRPLSEVILNATSMTNHEGVAYVEGNANPRRLDQLKNGLNIKDMMMIQAGILDLIDLTDNELLAADFSQDGQVTAIDVFNVERVLLGLDTETDVDWSFNDVTTEIETGLEPKGHYVAIKPGDIDDSADIGFGSPVYLTENLIFEDQLLNAGETYLVPLYIGNDIDALGTELNLTFDSDKVDIESVNSDQVFGSISFNILNGNRLAMITENFDLSVESIDSKTPLLTIEILATKNGTLSEVFGVSETDESFILDSEYNLIKIEELLEGAILLDNENLDNTLAIDVYPNPAVDFLIVEDNGAFNGEKIYFELFDVTGKRVLQSVDQKQLDISNLTSGMYVYKVTIGDKFTSNRILKQ